MSKINTKSVVLLLTKNDALIHGTQWRVTFTLKLTRSHLGFFALEWDLEVVKQTLKDQAINKICLSCNALKSRILTLNFKILPDIKVKFLVLGNNNRIC